MSILVDTVLMEGRQRQGDSDDDFDTDEDPFGFDLIPGGSDGNLDRRRDGVPVAAEIMAGRARVGGRRSYRGH